MLASGAQNSADGIKELAQAFSVLTPQQVQNCTALKGLNVQQLAAIVNATSLTGAEKAQFAAALSSAAGISADAAANTADATAKGANTAATFSLTAALKGLGATLKSFALAHHFLVAIALFAATVAVVDALTVSYSENEEKLQELRQETENVKSELTAFNNELKTTQGRIEELESKGPLTFVEQEELDKLKEQNAELERSIRLKENELKISERKENKQFLEMADRRETESVANGAYVTRDRIAQGNLDNYKGKGS